MSEVAIDKISNVKIFASDYDDKDWEKLRAAADSGQIVMACCGAKAVLKTSPNFLRFFAHFAGECATAPETKWHLEVKSLVINDLSRRNILCKEEKTGKSPNGKRWKADTYLEFNGRKIVIEVQHSYQHYNRYKERQKIYADSGIECYWLLYPKCFKTLTSSIAKDRIKNEFNGKIPRGLFGNSPDLPIMWFDLEKGLKVRSVAFIEYSLSSWIESIMAKKFKYQECKWIIEGLPLPTIRKVNGLSCN